MALHVKVKDQFKNTFDKKDKIIDFFIYDKESTCTTYPYLDVEYVNHNFLDINNVRKLRKNLEVEEPFGCKDINLELQPFSISKFHEFSLESILNDDKDVYDKNFNEKGINYFYCYRLFFYRNMIIQVKFCIPTSILDINRLNHLDDDSNIIDLNGINFMNYAVEAYSNSDKVDDYIDRFGGLIKKLTTKI